MSHSDGGMWITGETVNAGGGGQGPYGISLFVPLSFAVKLKLL